jgi:hypothetical protein
MANERKFISFTRQNLLYLEKFISKGYDQYYLTLNPFFVSILAKSTNFIVIYIEGVL